MNDADLKSDKEIIEKATSGPWGVTASLFRDARMWIESEDCALYLRTEAKHPKMAEDTTFIAAARSRWPAAIEEIERLKAILEQIKQGPIGGEYEWKKSWGYRMAVRALESNGLWIGKR